jgi:hypothetical protein
VIRSATNAAFLALGILLLAGASGAREVEFLHIEANVGSSAGGHTALRIGDRVFDFQNHDHGTLRLQRVDAEHFRYVYSVLDNRTIRVAQLDVTPETAGRILERFNRRYLIQNKHFAAQRAAARDVALLEQLAASGGQTRWDVEDVPGAGFFAIGTNPSQTLAALRDRIDANHGTGFLAARLASFERRAAAQIPKENPSSAPPLDPDRFSVPRRAFSDRTLELAAGTLAHRVLVHGASLRADALLHRGSDAPKLTDDQIRALADYRDRLADDLVRLAASERPDLGAALLLGMARLEAITRSVESHRLAVLDAFPAEAYVVGTKEVEKRHAFLSELEAQHAAEVGLAWSNFLAPGESLEPDYAWVESATNRHLEIQRGLREGWTIRLHGESILPRGVATGRALPRPALSPTDARRASVSAEAWRTSHEERLREAFGYALLSNNCATALFATLNAEFGPSEIDDALGGYISPGNSLNYIPTVAFDAVVRRYRIAEVGEVPSFRRTRIEADASRSSAIAVGLRESTTLTSSLYRSNPHDSFFVFFTQDVPVLRPVLGAFNLVAATGELTLGLFRVPFDRGSMVWSGLKGFATSLPELVFINLRKGHMDHAPGDEPLTSYRTVSTR